LLRLGSLRYVCRGAKPPEPPALGGFAPQAPRNPDGATGEAWLLKLCAADAVALSADFRRSPWVIRQQFLDRQARPDRRMAGRFLARCAHQNLHPEPDADCWASAYAARHRGHQALEPTGGRLYPARRRSSPEPKEEAASGRNGHEPGGADRSLTAQTPAAPRPGRDRGHFLSHCPD
jgi:hypothetical protein